MNLNKDALIDMGVVEIIAVDEASHRFQINPFVYQCIVDDDDGYRSYMDDNLELTVDELPSSCRFPPVAGKFQRSKGTDEDIIEFITVAGPSYAEGYCFLRLGTDNIGDYYPWYVFEFCRTP